MKIVLRHQATGRYYVGPGQWVRRADNALVFDDAVTAQNFVRSRGLTETSAVYRLAPYLIPLLQESHCQDLSSTCETWSRARAIRWYVDHAQRFGRN